MACDKTGTRNPGWFCISVILLDLVRFILALSYTLKAILLLLIVKCS